MKIFISHATKNKVVVLKFAALLESINNEIEVFCSSENGSIGIGKNFIETIFKELDESEIFIPIISEDYYTSRFSMIELGSAYSYLYNKYNKHDEVYIFPFALYPVRKGDALSGTPISNIQTGNLNDESDIRSLLNCLSLEMGLYIGSGTNQKIRKFISEINQVLLKNQNVLGKAKINTFFDDSIEFKRKEDVIRHIVTDNAVIVNYNMNPYKKDDVKRPNFMSLVLGYIDLMDINHFIEFNENAQFVFALTNNSNSIQKIHVEFKYSKNNRILETFDFSVSSGENKLSIPLAKMQSKALGEVSEICFVIHPDDVSEDNGEFGISGICIE